MGDVKDARFDFNRRCLSDDSGSNSGQEIDLVKYVIVFMIRGIVSFYVMGHFASEGFSSHQIYQYINVHGKQSQYMKL